MALAVVLLPQFGFAEDINGMGSTFVNPIMSKWAADYGAKTGSKVSYFSLGSAAGVNAIRAGSVDFGASDMPLTPSDLEHSDIVQFPIVIGGIVPVVNLEGVSSGAMRLTGPVLADIYLGKIKTWHDRAFAELNPSLTLPNADIIVVHRSDGSGTTFNWANYFSKINPEWKSSAGVGTSVQWPVGIPGRGNEGVAAAVKENRNSIGYVEFAYAVREHLSYCAVQNAAGQFVLPSAEAFQAAASNADWASAKEFDLVITNAPGDKAWPISATTFVMMRKHPNDPAKTAPTLAFITWALSEGQTQASALDYVPLPSDLVQQVSAYWQKALPH